MIYSSFQSASSQLDDLQNLDHPMGNTDESYQDEVLEAINSAQVNFGICPNRVWAVLAQAEGAESNLPKLMSHVDRCNRKASTPRQRHTNCTYEFCEYSHQDFTAVRQRHEEFCPGEKTCSHLTNVFPQNLLIRAVDDGLPTAWNLNGDRIITPPQHYMAISHVWSDGTGAGEWGEGNVNACLYRYFTTIAEILHCEGIWWDVISLPKGKSARSKAIQTMQSNYEDARVTLVHDCFLREWEWADDPYAAAFAIAVSPWFGRGWTALELLKSRKVKIIFKAPGGFGEVIKDLDEDILYHPSSIGNGSSFNLALNVIKKLRNRRITTVNDLLMTLGPRHTSRARDVATISALLVGVKPVGNQQSIYQAVFRKLGKIPHRHLFHKKASMSDVNFAWCSTSLLDLPLTSDCGSSEREPSLFPQSNELYISHSGALVGVWKVYPFGGIPEDAYYWQEMHPLTERKIRLQMKRHAIKLLLLVEPGIKSPSKAVLVLLMDTELSSRAIVSRYLGTVYFQEGYLRKGLHMLVQIGSVEGMEEIQHNAWDSINSRTKLNMILPFNSEEWDEEMAQHTQDLEMAHQKEVLYRSRNCSAEDVSMGCTEHLNSNLLKAAADGDLIEVKKLLDQGADVDSQDCFGRTPIHRAIWRCHFEIAEILFKYTTSGKIAFPLSALGRYG